VLSYTENGRIAQLVEQRIENPRVPGSIPGSATIFFFYINSLQSFFSAVYLRLFVIAAPVQR
jgi:hypothetical protein